jgi:heat shock protein HslJ
MKFKHLWVLSFLILLLACNDKKRNSEEEATPASTVEKEGSNSESEKITGATAVLDGTWMLTTFNKETIETTDAYKIPTLKIAADEGEVIGNAGCNEYSGTIEVKGDKKVNIQAERVSELDCPESSLEDDFLKAINAEGLAYKIQDETQLIFYTDNITMMFEKSR